ncbi:MAG: hypothetical protein AAB408_04665 [Patescibacteria group bacterium]
MIALATESSAIISTKSQATPKRRVPRALAIVRGQNDILHHHTRLTLDRLLLERFRLDDELSEAVAAVNMLSPRRHHSIGASWKFNTKTRGETFLIPTGPRFHLNRVLRNGERYISRISGITLALCKRCFLRVYYGRLKRLERRIIALSEQRREVNNQLNASRRLLSYARRYAFRRRTLTTDLGVQQWFGDSATTTTGGEEVDKKKHLSRYMQRLERVRNYITAVHAAMIDDLRYLYWRRMSLERSIDRLVTVAYKRRSLHKVHLGLVWQANASRACKTFKNPKGPIFNIIVSTDNGPKHIRVGRISRAACKKTNQLKDYAFLKRLEKNMKRYRTEYKEINRRLDAVRRCIKVIPRKPRTRPTKGVAS